MSTKAEGLPINVIIIAALGLAVLVVLFIQFTSEAADFSKTTLTCEAKGGTCEKLEDCQFEKTSFRCPTKEKPVCCVNPLGR